MKDITVDISLAKTPQDNLISEEELKNLILSVPDTKWADGTGVSTFTFFDKSTAKSKITLYASKGSGFLLQYEELLKRTCFFLVQDEPTTETDYVYSGGNGQLCYKDYLVSDQVVWEAVKYFIETGNMLEKLKWTADYRVPEDF